MVQTKEGALKAQKTMIKKLGKKGYLEHFKIIGAIGGRNGHTGGFAANPALARVAGAKGGRHGRVNLKLIKVDDGVAYYLDKKTGKKVKRVLEQEKED